MKKSSHALLVIGLGISFIVFLVFALDFTSYDYYGDRPSGEYEITEIRFYDDYDIVIYFDELNTIKQYRLNYITSLPEDITFIYDDLNYVKVTSEWHFNPNKRILTYEFHLPIQFLDAYYDFYDIIIPDQTYDYGYDQGGV
jgi:hypothetical protein